MKKDKLLYVLLLSLIVVGIVILLNFLSFSKIEDVMITQLKNNQLINTEHAAARIENHIIQVKDELITLSKFPQMDSLDINKCSGDMKIIHENIDGKINSLLRVNSNGDIVECSSLEYNNYIGLNINNKDYFRIPKETNEAYITGIVRQGTSQQIIVSAPLFETTKYTPYPNYQGEFKGILMTIVELSSLHALYLHPFLTGKNYFLLINLKTEETILKSNEIDEFSDLKDYLPETNNGFNSIENFNGFGKTIITSSDLILGTETWRLIVLTPTKNIESEIKSVQNRHLFSLAFVILIIISLFIFMLTLFRSKEEIQNKLEKTNITLEKMGINIEVEEGKFSQTDVILDPGRIYLIKEEEDNQAIELFIGSLNRGFAGLGIIRDNPRKIRDKYNLEKTSFIYLSTVRIENYPNETKIDNLFKIISEFIKKSKKSVILIERLDYIFTENNPDKVIKTIQLLKDIATANECIIIISIDSGLTDESKLKPIEAETVDLFGSKTRNNVNLTEIEIKILNFVNEKNISNKLVSYKDVTLNFNITKPTTRTKIRKLQSIGLLQIEQRGRFKSIKITSTGRRLI